VGFASAGFEIVGACEGLEEEFVALRLRGVDASAVGWDYVVALLVVVVAEELGLRVSWSVVVGTAVKRDVCQLTILANFPSSSKEA
jgi:uncharacterized ion transporter superfamily protein YfcC